MKKFTQVTKTINGTEYTAQFNGFSAMYKSIDNTYITGTNTTSVEKLSEYLLANVLVSPKKKVDDFEDFDELNEVIAFLSEVNNGSFRSSEDENATEETSKK